MGIGGNEGFVVIHRKMWKSAVAQDPLCVALWVWLLCEANWERRQLLDGSYLERGQLKTSLARISESTRLTVCQIRTRLKKLQGLDMLIQEIDKVNDKKGRLITICNYSIYQDRPDNSDKVNGKKVTSKRQEGDKKVTTEEQRNKGTREQGNKERGLFDTKPSVAKPTSLEEVLAHWQQAGLSGDPGEFWAFYESNGWKVGKNPMKKWRAAASGWSSRQKNGKVPGSNGKPNALEEGDEAIRQWLNSKRGSDGNNGNRSESSGLIVEGVAKDARRAIG